MIHQRQRNVLRHVKTDIATDERFALNLRGRLQELAHVAPFLFRADHSAFEAVHVEKVVHDPIQSPRAVVNFAGELLKYLRVMSIWRRADQFLAGSPDRGERRLQFVGNAIEQRLAEPLGLEAELDLRGEVFPGLELRGQAADRDRNDEVGGKGQSIFELRNVQSKEWRDK